MKNVRDIWPVPNGTLACEFHTGTLRSVHDGEAKLTHAVAHSVCQAPVLRSACGGTGIQKGLDGGLGISAVETSQLSSQIDNLGRIAAVGSFFGTCSSQIDTEHADELDDQVANLAHELRVGGRKRLARCW